MGNVIFSDRSGNVGPTGTTVENDRNRIPSTFIWNSNIIDIQNISLFNKSKKKNVTIFRFPKYMQNIPKKI